eukprot:1178183-Prymnesium_polylepis.1
MRARARRSAACRADRPAVRSSERGGLPTAPLRERASPATPFRRAARAPPERASRTAAIGGRGSARTSVVLDERRCGPARQAALFELSGHAISRLYERVHAAESERLAAKYDELRGLLCARRCDRRTSADRMPPAPLTDCVAEVTHTIAPTRPHAGRATWASRATSGSMRGRRTSLAKAPAATAAVAAAAAAAVVAAAASARAR